MAEEPNKEKSILEDEGLVSKLRKDRGGIKAFLKSISTVVIFALFVTTFTLLVLGEPYVHFRTFEHYIRRRFGGEDAKGGVQPLTEVKSIDEFWQYMDTTVMYALYGNESEYVYANRAIPPLIELDAYNRLLGPLRMRTVRVKPNEGCKVPDAFTRYFEKCYGQYSPESESTDPYGMPGQPFNHAPSTYGQMHSGIVSTYSSGGFMEVLTTNRTLTQELYHHLKKDNWVDYATRAIFLDLTVWNGNDGLYGVTRITFEIAPSGNWYQTMEVDVITQRFIKPFGYGTTMEWMMMIGDMILCLFILYYIAEELSELTILKLNYLKDGWNMLDWVNLSLLIVVFVVRLQTYIDADSLALESSELLVPSHFTDMHSLALNIRFVRHMNAVNAVLIWVKAVKYVNFIPYVTTMIWTIRLSWQLFVSFMVVFSSAFVGFVIAYGVGFGDKFEELNTFPSAALFLMRSFLGDADLTGVYYEAPLLGSLLIILFVLGIYFIMLNIFYGIMVNALEEAKAKQDEGANEKWEKFLQKIETFKTLVWKGLDLDQKIKKNLPGLYARMHRRRRDRMERDKLRKERQEKKATLKGGDGTSSLLDVEGPHNPNAGRRFKRKTKANEAAAALGDDSSDSEVDLGPLSDSMVRKGGGGGERTQRDKAKKKKGQVFRASSEAIMEAVDHMAGGLMERTNQMRSVVLTEMKEGKQILFGISDVLEVLNRRVSDLEVQQNQFLESG